MHLSLYLFAMISIQDCAWQISACLYENWMRNQVKVLFLTTDEMLLTSWKAILIYTCLCP